MGQKSSKQHPNRSIERLADVELQLVMHGLAAPDLLRFARCNKRMLHVASNSFAWHHTMLPASCVTLCNHAIPLSPLLRAAPLSIDLRGLYCIELQMEPHDALQLLLAREDGRLHIHGLDATHCWRINADQWIMIYSHPSLQSLRSLRVLFSADDRMMKLICSMPHLKSLTVHSVSDQTAWESLPNAPSLTDLYVSPIGNPIPSIQLCKYLRRLHIQSPNLYGARFLAFFASSQSTQQLQYLRIDDFDAKGNRWHGDRTAVPPKDYVTSFGLLTNLHTLHLKHCQGVDFIIMYVWHLRSIERLIIEPSVESDESMSGSEPTIPSIPVLADLFHASSPRLYISLRLFTSIPIGPKDRNEFLEGMTKKFASAMKKELAPYRLRFDVESKLIDCNE